EPLGYHSGVAVSRVDDEGPARQAGIQKGDIIVALRGRRHDELDASRSGRQRFAELVGQTIRGLIPRETLELALVRGEQLVHVELTVTAASPSHQAGIDAERMLGLRIDRDEAKIAELVRGSPISRVSGAEVLLGAKIIGLFGQPVADRAQLGERLASLRAWTASGGRRSIAIEFELTDGRRLAASNFPLAD